MLYKLKTNTALIVILMLSVIFLSCCSSRAKGDIDPDSQAYAYLEVFKDIANDINEEKTGYIAVNLTNITYPYPSDIKELIENYTRKYNVSVIWNDRKEEYDSFRKGYLIIFDDMELTDSKLTTTVECKLAPVLASSEFAYTVEKQRGAWTINNRVLNWIS